MQQTSAEHDPLSRPPGLERVAPVTPENVKVKSAEAAVERARETVGAIEEHAKESGARFDTELADFAKDSEASEVPSVVEAGSLTAFDAVLADVHEGHDPRVDLPHTLEALSTEAPEVVAMGAQTELMAGATDTEVAEALESIPHELAEHPEHQVDTAPIDIGEIVDEFTSEHIAKPDFKTDSEGSPTLQSLRSEIESNDSPDALRHGLEDSELEDLSKDMSATLAKNMDRIAEEQAAETGVQNPNSHSEGLFFGDPSDGVLMTEGNAYRSVDVRAVVDLIDSGVVRGAYTATKGGRAQTSSHTTYWSDGDVGRHHGFRHEGAFIIEASKDTLDAGWVTADKVKGLYTRDKSGKLVNLLP